MKNRVELTIIIGVCLLTFIPLFLAFNPARLNIFQNVAAVLGSGVIAIGAVALTWVHDIKR
jgi:heme O synthase-like polyprenyltransferase